MPKVSAEHMEARREQIIEAAFRAFASKGYSRTSMTDIFAEAGLSAGAIYTHFGSKDELMRSVAERVLAARQAEMTSGAHAPSPHALLEGVVRGFAASDFTAVMLQLWADAAVDAELRAIAFSAITSARTTIAAQLERWGAEHPEAVDGELSHWAREVMLVITGLLPGFVVQQTVLGNAFDLDDYLEAAKRVLPN